MCRYQHVVSLVPEKEREGEIRNSQETILDSSQDL